MNERARAAGSRYKYSRFTRVEGPDILETNLLVGDFYVLDALAFLIANNNRNFITRRRTIHPGMWKIHQELSFRNLYFTSIL